MIERPRKSTTAGYPETWDVDGFAEGPKLLRHGNFFYMLSAEGAPPDHRQVTWSSSRARSINGPWENANNRSCAPFRATKPGGRRDATMVEGPGGQCTRVSRVRNGYWTLGRQRFSSPCAGRRRLDEGFDVSRSKPRGEAVPHGFALSDDFSASKLGRQWNFYEATLPTPRAFDESGAMILRGRACRRRIRRRCHCRRDQACEMTLEFELSDGTAGLLLFTTRGSMRASACLRPTRHAPVGDGSRSGEARASIGTSFELRNDRHVVGLWHSRMA